MKRHHSYIVGTDARVLSEPWGFRVAQLRRGMNATHDILDS